MTDEQQAGTTLRVIETEFGRFALRSHEDYFAGMASDDVFASESMYTTAKRLGCSVVILGPGVDPSTVSADEVEADIRKALQDATPAPEFSKREGREL